MFLRDSDRVAVAGAQRTERRFALRVFAEGWVGVAVAGAKRTERRDAFALAFGLLGLSQWLGRKELRGGS